ncbi:thioredoxin domain-containing protein 3 homolog [Ciona intestinalis]
MAKRKEVILQETLNTQEAWEVAMSSGKLYVVDAHQKWCGPCTAIVGMLKRIKNELGDDLLRFATAQVDVIDTLEQYRGKCEPNFLFYGGGELVAAVRGCNAPLVQETIQESLKNEHKILSGDMERKVFRDVYSDTPDQEEEEEDEEEEEGGVVSKQITVALIKPDVVQNGQVDEILQKISEAGIEVLADEERMLTEEEARDFYKNKEEEEYFNHLIDYVTSGPCRVLVLTKGESGEGVVTLWRDIIGPFDAAVAKEENPDSLRAIYGTDATSNALHGSSSTEEAVRELGFFFPDFKPPTYRSAKSAASRASGRRSKTPSQKPRLQRTLAIIRPDALQAHKDSILQKIGEAGFKIAMQKEMVLTREQAESFYSEHKDKDYFEPLVKQMTCGPVLALCLAHDDAVDQWRSMLGPKVVADAVEEQPDSLRAQFRVEEAEVNMLHGSDSAEAAEEELSKIFNVEQTLAVIKPDAIDEKEQIMEKLKEAGFMISCQKDMNLSKEIAGEIYKSKEGSEYYDHLIDHMTSGPTLMMVLSAENAVEKLRDIMGPTDPEVAKESHPESLRAMFAKSILENAIHSPSTNESAQEKIRIVFGDAQFDWDGTLQENRSDVNDMQAEEGEANETSGEQPADEQSGEAEKTEEDGVHEEEQSDEPQAVSGDSQSRPSSSENDRQSMGSRGSKSSRGSNSSGNDSPKGSPRVSTNEDHSPGDINPSDVKSSENGEDSAESVKDNNERPRSVIEVTGDTVVINESDVLDRKTPQPQDSIPPESKTPTPPSPKASPVPGSAQHTPTSQRAKFTPTPPSEPRRSRTPRSRSSSSSSSSSSDSNKSDK